MSFFDVESVVVIGASENEGKIGNTIIKKLATFSGKKYGVNPSGGGYKDIIFYKTIKELPMIPDMAVIAIKADYVSDSLESLGKLGVKRSIIISAGFKEVGNIEGEEILKKIAKKYKIELLGPNCLGYFDVCKNLDLSFGGKNVACGNVAIISQSGAMAVALVDWAISQNLGISKIISMGNKAGVNENSLLELLSKDENTKVIAMYLESIESGEKFYKITRKLSKKIPIILVKSGISERGSKAASSHTGALASKKEILESAFLNSGIHSTHSMEDFFLWSHMFSRLKNEDIKDEMLIITNAGGPGVMATDHIELNGIKLANLSKDEKEILKNNIPESASVQNPIDIIGDATSKTYAQILQNIAKLKQKRALLIILTTQTMTDVENIAKVIVDFKRDNPKQLLFVSFMGGKSVEAGRKILKDNNILEYDYPKKAILAYKELLKQKSWEKTKAPKIEKLPKIDKKIINKIKKEIKNQEQIVGNTLISKILKTYSINYVDEYVVNEKKQIKDIYKKIGKNDLVARIISPDIAHKSDVGGVILNIKSLTESEKAYDSILKNIKNNAKKAKINGISFSKMMKTGKSSKEVFVGFKKDKNFGNIVLVGLGGIYVNVFEDVSIRVGLVSKYEILDMFKQLKTYKILSGTRGEKAINFEKLIDIIYKLQFVFKDFDEISEIDINPIISDSNNSTIVDAKFYL